MASLSDFTILVVDDEPEIGRMLAFEVESLGSKCLTAENGKVALEILAGASIDLVITDVRMPECDGVQLLEMIRRKSTLPPVALISGFADIALWEAFDRGAEAWFGKPFRLDEIETLIKRLTCPDDQRWRDLSAKPVGELMLTFSAGPKSTIGGSFSIGRGGIFVGESRPTYSKGDSVEFALTVQGPSTASLKGVGEIKWVRSDMVDNLPAGYGIEFGYLDPSIRMSVIKYIRTTNPRAYIPKGPMA